MQKREMMCTVFCLLLALMIPYRADAQIDVNDPVLEGLSAEYRLDDDTDETSVIITNSLMSVPLDWSLDLTMVGGGFTLDWIDSNDANHPVQDFNVYASLSAGDLWHDEAVLEPGQSTLGLFTPIPEARYYVLTYTGEFEGMTMAVTHSRGALHTIVNLPTDVSLLACFQGVIHKRYETDEENALNMRGILLTPHPWGGGVRWKCTPTRQGDEGRLIWAECSSDGDIFTWARADKLDDDYMFHSGSDAHADYFPQWIDNQCGVGSQNYDAYGGGCVIQECDVNIWDANTESYCPGDQVTSMGWFTRWNKWDKVNERVEEDEVYEIYTCLVEHVPGDANEPGIGEAWQDVWLVGYPDVSLSLKLDGIPAGQLSDSNDIRALNLLILEGPYALLPTLGIAKLEIVGDPNTLQIWDNDTTTGTPLLNSDVTSLEWDLSQGLWPTTLYVQGVEPGTAQIVFSFHYAGRLFYDKVRVAVDL